jgi:peroxiredoxin
VLRRSLALALVAVSLAGCSLQTDLRDRLVNPVRAGKAAPAFLTGSVEGTAVSLGDFGGAPLVLNFWGAWCPPCRDEQPALQRVSQEFEANGVRFLGVDVGDTLGRARDFQRDYRVTYPSAYDPRGQVAHTYRVDVFPTTFLIDDKGIIVHRRQGALSDGDLRSLIRTKLLKAKRA